MYLNDPVQLTLEFDELMSHSTPESDFWVGIVNCNEFWEPTDLIPIEFIEGFSTDRIYTFDRSQNTKIPYVHYSYRFPTDNVRFKRSGNYLLKVFRAGDEDDLVITKRIFVADNKIRVEPLMGKSLAVSQRNRLQRVDFNIHLNNMDIMDPRQDLTVVMLQNGRWDNAIFGLEPVFQRDQTFEYQFDANRQFDGGNEYRLLDIRTFRFYTEKMKEVINQDSIFEIELYVDEPRLQNRYFTEPDQNGNFIIGVQEYNNDDWEADYAWVNFKLKMYEPVTDGDVYVLGAMTQWQCNEENKMTYNPAAYRYETSMLLKQGFYNYEYAILEHQSNELDETRLEGSHFETENYYTILVYYNNPIARSPELIGISHVNYYDR